MHSVQSLLRIREEYKRGKTCLRADVFGISKSKEGEKIVYLFYVKVKRN